MKTHTIVMTTW